MTLFSHGSTIRALLTGFSIAAMLAATPANAQNANDLLKQPPGKKVPDKQLPIKQLPANQDAAELDDRANVKATLKRETDIIRSLAPFADGNPGAAPDVREVDGDRGKVRVDYGRAIDITVFFEYDSARLTPEARIQLEPLANALQSRELLPYRFLIAGHTDAVGSAGYNRNLSLKRASSVRRFLSVTYGVDPDRLVIHGWGESRLKDEDRPRAGINRRVEVALILPKIGRAHV